MILIDRFQIIKFIIFPTPVAHSNFLSLIQERQSSLAKNDRRKCWQTVKSIIFFWNKQTCTSWLVMIFNNICFKPSLLNDLLIMECLISPFIKWLRPVIIHIIVAFSVSMTRFKRKDRGKISFIPDKPWKNIFFHKHCLTHRQCIIWFKTTLLHLHQEITDSSHFIWYFIDIRKPIRSIWF